MKGKEKNEEGSWVKTGDDGRDSGGRGSERVVDRGAMENGLGNQIWIWVLFGG